MISEAGMDVFRSTHFCSKLYLTHTPLSIKQERKSRNFIESIGLDNQNNYQSPVKSIKESEL